MAAPLTLHIALLFEFPTLNGGEHSMLSVLRKLRCESDIRFTAIAPPDGPLADELQQLNIPLVSFIVRSDANVKRDAAELTAELQAIVAARQPDILHANSLSMSRLVGQVRDRLNSVCCTGHIRDIMKLSARAICDLNQLNGIAVVSQATRDFHKSQGLRLDRTNVIYNGIDTDQFCRRSQTKFRNSLLPQLPESAQVLLNVGQICLRKGQRDLAQAVIQLLQTRDDVYLVLVGKRYSEKAESVAYDRAISDEFATAGRENHLLRIGYCDNVEQWMNAADLLVHTARQEPLGRVLLEAAACKLPIVATNVGGTSEILQHERSGILLPPGDADVLTNGLHAALNQLDQSQSYAACAAEHVRQAFTVTQASDALLTFWQNAHRQE